MPIPEGPSLVHILSEHHLVTQKLTALLVGEPSLQVQPYNAEEKSETAAHVFVIDAASLKAALEPTLRNLRIKHPDAKVVVIAENGEGLGLLPMALHWRGVHAWLPQKDVELCLVPAVRAVIVGMLCMQRDAVPRFHEDPDGLTAREAEILGLLQRRFSNREIAEAFGLQESTVKWYVARIVDKLGAGSRRDLALR